MIIQENDLIFLYKDDRRNYLVKANKNRLHCDLGYIDLAATIGKEYGSSLETNLGHKFYLLVPPLFEKIMKIKRMTQIIYPKEIGMILMQANIFPGAKVIESGIGSGALTTALANFVRPNGKVYSYERNPQFLENARKNLEKYGLAEYVEFNNIEIFDQYPQKDADFVMIDIGSQWALVPAAYNALKGGCRLATICPTFDQLTKTVFTMEETGFINIETIEIQVRKILVRRGKTRPEQHMPCHTGWLVFGSKILEKPGIIPEETKKKAEKKEEELE
jgi:tRNA (adenine57-N1/adenine58-N1)-methyltransferase